MLKLVGDNPFHGVSHVSQERAINRGIEITQPKHAANILNISLESGAEGFMFSISNTTLAVLKILTKEYKWSNLNLYAITPAAGEFARTVGTSGGLEGIGRVTAKQMVFSGNLSAIFDGLRGIAAFNWENIMRSYFRNEISRVKRVSHQEISSLMLHEIVTDMALALGLQQLFVSYISLLAHYQITPGFESRNFVLLINRFKEWNIELSEVTVASPFNKVGFQMTPSQRECEQTLQSLGKSNVIAISTLAAGYLKPNEALSYVNSLNLKGAAIAVSNERQARETFRFLQ